MTQELQAPVLLAPAGDFESLQAALDNGANAVYFGVGNLNMRSRATVNFQPEDLSEVVSRCHERGVKAWLALNIIVYDEELPDIRELCSLAKRCQVDAVIASDIAVMMAARAEGLSVHLSVQANICNLESVKFYAQFADVMVLARELRLEQIRGICRAIREQRICGPSGELLQVEVFAHGALCVAISGKCYMSLADNGHSGNRGACFQNCRRKYTVRDTETGREFDIQNQYVMSPKDLCTVGVLDELLGSGISVLKLEGRGRSADYVARVTGVYREAIDHLQQGGKLTPELVANWEQRLSEVFNRGFWRGGYYLGCKWGEWAGAGDNLSTTKKTFIGTVVDYYAKPQVAEILLTAGSCKLGDRLLVTGNATGAVELCPGNLQVDYQAVTEANKGDDVTFFCSQKLRMNDKVYRIDRR